MRLLWCAALLLAASVAPAQKLPWQGSESGSSFVSKRPQDVQYLFPEQISVAAGKDAVVDLHFKVNPGMHINSHTPREKSLIATRLIVAEMPGMKIGPVEFPAGSDYTLAAMPNDKLSVYTGEFVLRATIHATAGQHMFEGALRYQACDTNSCYPPREAPIAVDVIAH
ncbi:MAG: protein-disulfide reductase DsbD domain-containing protein [Silvibacterium sp.]